VKARTRASLPTLHMFVRFSESPSPPSPLSPAAGNPWLNLPTSQSWKLRSLCLILSSVPLLVTAVTAVTAIS
jgi:hypothetical protein